MNRMSTKLVKHLSWPIHDSLKSKFKNKRLCDSEIRLESLKYFVPYNQIKLNSLSSKFVCK